VTQPSAPTLLPAGGDNALAVSLGILGDEWNLWVLRYALQGARRYTDWMQHGTISSAVLTDRLRRLTEQGLLTTVAAPQRATRFEYELTARGRSTWPVLLSMWAWEHQWAPKASGLPAMFHGACQCEFHPVLVCRRCMEPVLNSEVSVVMGPSGHWNRSIPAAAGRRRSRTSVRPTIVLPHTMRLIGNRWSSALLGSMFLGANRFRDFSERTGATPAIVADRLRQFKEVGVIVEQPSLDRADWVTYELSDKGAAFLPTVIFMFTWGQRWFRAPDGDAIDFKHARCGDTLDPLLACSECNAALDPTDVFERDRRSGRLVPSCVIPAPE
jgi:DNA-binding HxlR family transcriptional regulator